MSEITVIALDAMGGPASVHALRMLPALPRLQSSSYFPLSAINNSISCSLIPTIASPRSVESSAIRLASV